MQYAYTFVAKIALLVVYFTLPSVTLAKSVASLKFAEQDDKVICSNSYAEYQGLISVMTYFLILILLLIFNELCDDLLDMTPLYRELQIVLCLLLQHNDFRYCKVLYRGVLQQYTSHQFGFTSVLPKGFQDLPRRISFIAPRIRDSYADSPSTQPE